MEFEWDPAKNLVNLEKHGLLFEDVIPVFLDPYALTVLDDRKEYGEDRFVTIGAVDERTHVIAHCQRGQNTIRIISARKANKREQRIYERYKIQT